MVFSQLDYFFVFKILPFFINIYKRRNKFQKRKFLTVYNFNDLYNTSKSYPANPTFFFFF